MCRVYIREFEFNRRKLLIYGTSPKNQVHHVNQKIYFKEDEHPIISIYSRTGTLGLCQDSIRKKIGTSEKITNVATLQVAERTSSERLA